MGAASSSQAMAPRNGGVTNEAITSTRMACRSGMSVRATIQPMGAATRQQVALTETAMVKVVSNGSTKAGSVKTQRKLASVTWPARSVRAKTKSQAMGSTISRHRIAANAIITTREVSKRRLNVRAARPGSASTLKAVSPVRAPQPRSTPSNALLEAPVVAHTLKYLA